MSATKKSSQLLSLNFIPFVWFITTKNCWHVFLILCFNFIIRFTCCFNQKRVLNEIQNMAVAVKEDIACQIRMDSLIEISL